MSNKFPFLWSLLLLGASTWSAAADVPHWLPRYDLDVHLRLDEHLVVVRERVTWTNRHERPADRLVFNAHAHYQLPESEVGHAAKMLEILRLMPSDVFDWEGPPLQVNRVRLLGVNVPVPRISGAAKSLNRHVAEEQEQPPVRLPRPRPLRPEAVQPTDLSFHFDPENETALVVPLPKVIGTGENVSVEIEFHLRLPQKQGRWGQWEGVTFLANWLPVVAYFDNAGWQPAPFIPWHQPFFNEAGIYHVQVTLPCGEHLASSGTIVSEKNAGNGWKEVEIIALGVRDFALVCSSRFRIYEREVVLRPPSGTESDRALGDSVRVRVFAFPEHEHYATFMLRVADHALKTYSRWFGLFPYPDFTIVESFFGWNGNECGDLVMIDARIFGMPHIAEGFVDNLVSHEICHQWWYNVVGTNGYAETWMDEGLATYFSFRLMVEKYGKESYLIQFPRYLEWLPNIKRNDYRSVGLYGVLGRGEETKTVQEIPKFGHLINLFAMTYDKGSRIVEMIEYQVGQDTFTDFMRTVYAKYQYRILRVADFQRELEAYTGRSWEEFFQNWLYGSGMSDWSIKKVHIDDIAPDGTLKRSRLWRRWRFLPCCRTSFTPVRVTVLLKQKAEINEITVLGFRLDDSDGYQIRIPIVPGVEVLELPEFAARVESLADNLVRVVIDLPQRPTQIAVDPDRVLLDRNPVNNTWKPQIRWRFSPIFTFLDENDLSTAYDRWNVTVGPWFHTPTFENPFFTRSTRFGFRAGAYRTQWFSGGVYAAYRTDYRDLVAGVDGTFDHFPFPRTQVGFVAERRLLATRSGDRDAHQTSVFGRYIIDYGDSLYLPPFQYVEVFGTFEDNLLPLAQYVVPDAQRFKRQNLVGIHYHKNYLTPYWDAEGGYQFDLTYAAGDTDIEGFPDVGSHQITTQFSMVKKVPSGWGWLSTTRLAGRVYAGVGFPDRVQFYALGGGTNFRGFNLGERQGSVAWVGSLEWRVPLCHRVVWDVADHVAGVRNIYGAAFYDVGATYVRGRQVGNVAHALGVGLRFDIAWFAIIERSIFRIDAAKTINDATPWQFWIGIKHPF
ncbi:MAG: hypothetical protein KatS3mg105_2778 [Gemmatales bacterium]|nr:MAG: hypothetical protein KatS3mg105_2778 [Gemmatales bacterium]